MKQQLRIIKEIMEELMRGVKYHNEVLPRSKEELKIMDELMNENFTIAETVNNWAFKACKNGKLPWNIARLIQADCLDNEVNMETWHTINHVLLNADILLKQ